MQKLQNIQSFSEFINEGTTQHTEVKRSCVERLSQFFRVSPNALSHFKFDGKDPIKDLTKALNATSYEGAEQYYRIAIQMAKRDLGINESEEIFENVYPDKNGQLNAYDKKNFTEVGRRTFVIGKDLAAIFLFGYTKHDWKGEEWVVSVTCTSYNITVNNLGNSSGSIIYSESFGTENDALMAAHSYLKNFKAK
jgi:hypothetical protein